MINYKMNDIKKALENLKEQMVESEAKAYELLDDIPGPIKFIGDTFIQRVKTLLETENKKVWKKINELEKQLASGED